MGVLIAYTGGIVLEVFFYVNVQKLQHQCRFESEKFWLQRMCGGYGFPVSRYQIKLSF